MFSVKPYWHTAWFYYFSTLRLFCLFKQAINSFMTFLLLSQWGEPFFGEAWVATNFLITCNFYFHNGAKPYFGGAWAATYSCLHNSTNEVFYKTHMQPHIVCLHVRTHGRNLFIDYYVNTTSDIMAPHCDLFQSCFLWFRAIAKSVSLFKLYAVLNWLIVNISSYLAYFLNEKIHLCL